MDKIHTAMQNRQPQDIRNIKLKKN